MGKFGKPSENGVYWAKLYEWNSRTGEYDIESYAWQVVSVDYSEGDDYCVGLMECDELTHIDRIYEYESIDIPRN